MRNASAREASGQGCSPWRGTKENASTWEALGRRCDLRWGLWRKSYPQPVSPSRLPWPVGSNADEPGRRLCGWIQPLLRPAQQGLEEILLAGLVRPGNRAAETRPDAGRRPLLHLAYSGQRSQRLRHAAPDRLPRGAGQLAQSPVALWSLPRKAQAVPPVRRAVDGLRGKDDRREHRHATAG